MSSGDTELARRVEAMMELLGWQYEAPRTHAESLAEWKAICARHGFGLVPPPAVGKGERWWKHEHREWNLRSDGTLWTRSEKWGEPWRPSVVEVEGVLNIDGVIETDAHGAPLAVPERTGDDPQFHPDLCGCAACIPLPQPAATQDGMEERATAAWMTPEYRPIAGPVRMVKFARAECQPLRERIATLEADVVNLVRQRDSTRCVAAKIASKSPRRAPARGKTGRTKRKDRP